MRQVDDPGHQRSQTLIDQVREMTNHFLFTHLNAKFLFNLLLAKLILE